MGSHLTDKPTMDVHEVTVDDNLLIGSKRNIERWIGHENFELIDHDVVEQLYTEDEYSCAPTLSEIIQRKIISVF